MNEMNVRPLRHRYVMIAKDFFDDFTLNFKSIFSVKIFFMAISQIDPYDTSGQHIFWIDMKEAVDILGVKKDANHRAAYIKKLYRETMKDTFVKIEKPYGGWSDQYLIYGVDGSPVRGYVAVSLNPELLQKYFQGFSDDTGTTVKPYTKVWLDDIYELPRAARGTNVPYSAYLYLELVSRARYLTGVKVSSVSQAYHFNAFSFKEMIGMDLKAYTEQLPSTDRPGETKAHFQSAKFREKVLDKAFMDVGAHAKAVRFDWEAPYYQRAAYDDAASTGINYTCRYRVFDDLATGQENAIPLNDGEAGYLTAWLCDHYSDSEIGRDRISSIAKRATGVDDAVLDACYNGRSRTERLMQFVNASIRSMLAEEKRTGKTITKKDVYVIRSMDNECRAFASTDRKEWLSSGEVRMLCSRERSPETVRQLVKRATAMSRSYGIDLMQVKERVCELADIGKQSLPRKTWIDPLVLSVTGTDVFVVWVPDEAFADFVSKKYGEHFRQAVRDLYQMDVHMVFAADGELKSMQNDGKAG